MNYQKVHDQLIQRARVRILEGYSENHHIVPKCLGGSNKKFNLVKLTAREHFIVHRLLCKIYFKEGKLKFAMLKFIYGNKFQKEASSKCYEKLKIEFSKLCSELARERMKDPAYKKRCLEKLHTRDTWDKLKGRKLSLEHRDKLRNARLGSIQTEASNLKRSKSLLGRSKTKEHRDKCSKSKIGIKLSQEHIKNLKESHLKKVIFSLFLNGVLIGTWDNREKCQKDLNLNKSGLNKLIRGFSKTYKKFTCEVHRG